MSSYQVDADCLAALKLVPNWFVTSKKFETFHDALLANNDIQFSDEDLVKPHVLKMNWVFLV